MLNVIGYPDSLGDIPNKSPLDSERAPSRAILLSEVLFHREALALALRGFDDVELVDAVADVHAALVLADEKGADVMIVDSPSEAVAQALAAHSLSCRIVFIGSVGESCRQFESRGDAIFVGTSSSLDEVHVAMRFATPRPVAPRMAATHSQEVAAGATSMLTQREREIGRLAAGGCSNKEIATTCGISTATVKNHVHKILGKLNLRRRAQLARLSAMTLFVATLAGCAASHSPASAPASGPAMVASQDADPLPTDPDLLHGALENGLSYYVRRDRLPGGGAYLGLVVKGDGGNERDGQQDLAHLMGHLVFSGTPRFPNDKLADVLRALGTQPTADRHIVTSVDFTVYALELPAKSDDALQRALDLLGEWSSAFAFEPAQVERERRVVLEEMRQSGGPAQQLARQTLDIMLRGSGSVARPPVSAERVVEKTSGEQLRALHTAWYRPERMAVIAVGELEPRRLEQAIRERFARIKAPGLVPGPAVPLVEAGRDVSAATSFAVVAAPEPDESQQDEEEEDEPEDRPPPVPTVISIGFKRSRSPIRTRADLRQSVIESVYGSLLQARLDKLVQRPSSPLSGAHCFNVPQLPLNLSMVQAVVKPGRLEAGVQALWAELRAVGRQGFEAGELAGARAASKPSPVAPAPAMTAHFLYGDALLGSEAGRDLKQRLLGQVGLAEINVFARVLSTSARKVVVASGPNELLRPEQTLQAAVARAESGDPGSPPAGATGEALLDVLPAAGSVLREGTFAEVGATVWTLSNGATVVIKPTHFKPGEILFQARAAGGTSLASDRDYWSATLAPQIVSAGGLGRYSPATLGKLLTGRGAEGHPWVSETEHGIHGRATPEDLELMLQLVYLGFTAPRADAESFEAIQDRWREQLRLRDADADRVFAEVRRQQSFGNHPRRRSATMRSVGQLRLAAALDFYRQRFAQASDFTFVFVGDIDRDRSKPLIERYLASLPNLRGQRQSGNVQWRDVGARLADGVKRIRVERGDGDTSTVMLTFHRETPWSPEAETALDALRGYVEIRAREALVPPAFAARSISVTAELERRPIAQSSLTVTFDCERAQLDGAKRVVLRLIREVQESPARPSDVAAVRDARRQHLDRQWQENAFWLRALAEHQGSGSDPRDIQKLRAGAERIDAAMIERAARDDLDLRRYVEAVRSPRRR